MPKDKDLKRLVRSRMEKTGESYTTARAQLLAKRERRKKAKRQAAPMAPQPDPSGYAELAGMSDEAVARRTGKSWEEWVRTLDDRNAASKPHREIAAALKEDFGVSSWWAQTVTVGYERIKGLRDIGQRRGGGYEAGKSKTFPVPLARLYGAFSDPENRERWLPGVELEVRNATEERSMRITWEDDTSVGLRFTAKGDAKSHVQIEHGKLATKKEAEAKKAYWAERLAVFGELLETEPSGE
jgi:hypothetical protein